MKSKSYSITNLSLKTVNNSYQHIESLNDDHAANSAVKLIKKAIQREKLETLEAKYGDSGAFYIMV